MNTISQRLLLMTAGIAGVAALAAPGFTASNTLPAASVVRGYGSQTITGVTAQSVNYSLDSTKETITGVGLVLTGDTTARAIEIAFSDAAPAACSGTGTYESTASTTTYSCTVSQAVASAGKFALIAS
jgi:hypothetical protein